MAYSDRKQKESNSRRITSINNYNEWPIDSIEINALKLEYKSDTLINNWLKSDFNKIKLTIIRV